METESKDRYRERERDIWREFSALIGLKWDGSGVGTLKDTCAVPHAAERGRQVSRQHCRLEESTKESTKE